MAKEYIEREAAYNAIVRNYTVDDQLSDLDKIPAADVRPVRHGKWINAYPEIEPNPMFMYGIYSVCGFEQSVSDKLKYCPNCGALMDDKDGDGDV